MKVQEFVERSLLEYVVLRARAHHGKPHQNVPVLLAIARTWVVCVCVWSLSDRSLLLHNYFVFLYLYISNAECFIPINPNYSEDSIQIVFFFRQPRAFSLRFVCLCVRVCAFLCARIKSTLNGRASVFRDHDLLRTLCSDYAARLRAPCTHGRAERERSTSALGARQPDTMLRDASKRIRVWV